MSGIKTVKLNRPETILDKFDRFSSDDYAELINETLLPADLGLTFFLRYGLLWAQLNNPNAPVLPDDGFGVDWTKYNIPHTAIALGLTFLFMACNFVRTYQKQKRRNQNNSDKHIYDEIQKQSPQEKNMEPDLSWLDECLKGVLARNTKLQEKYDSIEFKNNELRFKTKENNVALKSETTEKDTSKPTLLGRAFNGFKNKFIEPVYMTGGVSSYVYWIMWIAVGGFTARFGQGIDGLPLWATFGIPAALGLIYPTMKTLRYTRNRIKQPEEKNQKDFEEQMQANADAAFVLREALLLRKSQQEKSSLQREYEQLAGRLQAAESKDVKLLPAEVKTDLTVLEKAPLKDKNKNEIAYLTEDLRTKAAITGTGKMGGSYIANQYTAWFLTDWIFKVFHVAVNAIPIVNLIAGAALILFSVVHGLYKAAQSYAKNKEIAKEAQKAIDAIPETEKSLEDIYEENRKELERVQQQLGESLNVKFLEIGHPQFYKEEDRAGTQAGSQMKKFSVRGMTFFNGFMSGAFLARLDLVTGTAIVLPFAALMLSVAWTVTLIAAAGIAWGAFKVWEYNVQRREARAKEALQKQAQRKEYVKGRIEMIGLAMNVLACRKVAKKLPGGSTPVDEKAVQDVAPAPQNNDSDCGSFARGLCSKVGSFAASAGRSLLPGAGAVRGPVSRRPSA